MTGLEKYMIPCPVKTYTGMLCPGCGMQRAIVELLSGNIIDSIIAYPPLITVCLMLIFLFFHLKFDLRYGAKILKISFIINSIIITLNYIINLLM